MFKTPLAKRCCDEPPRSRSPGTLPSALMTIRIPAALKVAAKALKAAACKERVKAAGHNDENVMMMMRMRMRMRMREELVRECSFGVHGVSTSLKVGSWV